jgi:hypothetical protein
MAQAANGGSGHLGWLQLADTAAWSSTAILWNNTAPTTTVFSIGTYDYINFSGSDYVAYCFSEIPGYSKFGSYVGTGDSNGPMVVCNFRPRYVMVKRIDTGGYNWVLFDSARSQSNVVGNELYPNLSDIEGIDNSFDFTANGFKLRVTSGNKNATGGTYIYMALAEHPFGGSNVSPSPAR